MADALAAPRSVLYVPASNPRAIEKARTVDADAVFLDLEDAVAPDRKDEARAAAVEAVRAGFPDKLVAIRCNPLDTPWGDADWDAALGAGPDAVLAPKIGRAADVHACAERLAGAPARMRLWVMIETAEAVLNLREVAAAASGRLQALIAGTNDLARDLRCRRTSDRAPLLPSLALTVAAARAHGLWAFDGVYNDFSDPDGFASEARQGADFGFDGKTLIHPGQIEPCNRIFSPSPDELAWARKVVAAFQAPEAEGRGAIAVDGKMVEHLHLAEARRLLSRARAPDAGD
jgi:citrate lyase subunit beta / citryl-CoA lyase